MLLAVLIDAVDGPLARRFRVADSVPTIDGGLLDNVVDYLNYAVAPAYFIHRLQLLPGPAPWIGAAAICVAAAFQFSHVDSKHQGHMFRGFPSYWNVVAFYFLTLRPGPGLALAVVLSLAALSFLPVYFVYPTRTASYRGATAIVVALFAACIGVTLIRYPDPTPLALGASLLFGACYLALSVALTVGRPRLRPNPGHRGP